MVRESKRCEEDRGSGRRGIEPGAASQQCDLTDAGRMCGANRRATGVSVPADRNNGPSVGRINLASVPQCCILTGPETGGSSVRLILLRACLVILAGLFSGLTVEVHAQACVSGGACNPSSLNRVLYVDGVTYSLQSAIAAANSSGNTTVIVPSNQTVSTGLTFTVTDVA